MHSQKGFTAIHLIMLLMVVGLVALGYVYYDKSKVRQANEASIKTLSNYKTKVDDKMQVAGSTPRIGLGAVMNDLASIKSEIAVLELSECLMPAKEALMAYTANEVSMMSDFALQKFDEDNPEAYVKYTEDKSRAENQFIKHINACEPK